MKLPALSNFQKISETNWRKFAFILSVIILKEISITTKIVEPITLSNEELSNLSVREFEDYSKNLAWKKYQVQIIIHEKIHLSTILRGDEIAELAGAVVSFIAVSFYLFLQT